DVSSRVSSFSASWRFPRTVTTRVWRSPVSGSRPRSNLRRQEVLPRRVMLPRITVLLLTVDEHVPVILLQAIDDRAQQRANCFDVRFLENIPRPTRARIALDGADLAHKWGLTGNLAGGYPYKTTP